MPLVRLTQSGVADSSLADAFGRGRQRGISGKEALAPQTHMSAPLAGSLVRSYCGSVLFLGSGGVVGVCPDGWLPLTV